MGSTGNPSLNYPRETPRPMTPNQAKILDAFEVLTRANGGICPSFSEVARHCGLKSKSSITGALDSLEAQGLIVRLRGGRRRVEIVRHADIVADALVLALSKRFGAGPVDWAEARSLIIATLP